MERVIIEKLSEKDIRDRGIKNWSIWEKEVSRFDWQYDGDEECLILEGEITIETSEGKFNIVKGDFVTFKDGLKCVWDIKKPVKKHYNFPG
jgi:uncharacterized cupin superfamily protein